ncbi:MAG: sigma-70 family RNA polymerase sigma factor [Holophagales bacterium]|nr:sigma-70 family RNA polymerase sigma factor [Holophagales bacterium]
MPRGRPGGFPTSGREYQRVLYNVAYRMVHDREDARDLAQGAFVKAYEKLGSYDPAYQFFSWIYRILVNDTLNFLKRNRPYQPLESTWDAAAPGGPREELEARELSRTVRGALMALSVDYREVVVLRHFAELSYGEMSVALAIPEKTVKSRLHTARQRLAEILGGGGAR